MRPIEALVRGPAFTIFVARGTKSEVDEVLTRMNNTDPDKRRAEALLVYVAEHGPPINLEKCRPVKSFAELFEFKAGRVRIPFFYRRGHRGQIVLTHVFFKRKNARAEYRYAQSIRAQIEQEVQA